jgi:hypothetical protein
LRFPLFTFIAQETGHSPAGGDHDEAVPPVWRTIRHAIPDPEALRCMSDHRLGGEAEEGQ